MRPRPAILPQTDGSSPRAPTGLLCDLLSEPSLVPMRNGEPSLSWMVDPDTMQQAYQVQVATTEAVLAHGGDLWDSGVVASAQSVAVRYRGKELAPRAQAWWRVRTQDRLGISPWSNAQAFVMADELEPGPAPCLPLTTTAFAPARILPVAERTWLIDFGRAAFGWVELEIDSPMTTDIAVRLGEKLDAAGRVDLAPGGTIRAAVATVGLVPGRHRYRVELTAIPRHSDPAAVRVPERFGVIMPLRYVEVIGVEQAPSATLMMVHYPFDDGAATFTSGDATLDAVWELCRHSIKATTFCGIYVDGDRERIAYEADAYLNQLCHYGVDREFALARATYDHLLAQPTWPTEWAQHMVLIAWADWMHTGDLTAVKRTWRQLVTTKSLRERMRPDGLLDTTGMRDIVDWPPAERDGFVFTPVNAVVNAFHFRVHECLADLAEALGRTDEEATFRRDVARIRTAFNRVFFDAASVRYVDGEGTTHASQHANMLPLAFGLVEPEHRAGVVAFTISRGMACSVYGAQYLLEGLFLNGAADTAIALMATRGPRGWWSMIEQGSTITLEAWDMPSKPNLDWNHAWGAAPANILPRFVLGVRPLTAGCASILIAPQPGPLAKVAGMVPTIRGPVGVTVFQRDGGFTVKVSIPGNTTARVEVPGGADARLSVDGRAVLAERTRDGWAVAGLGPGQHVVTRL